MPYIDNIELSEDEVNLAYEMGLDDYINYENDKNENSNNE